MSNLPTDLPRLPKRPIDSHKGTFGTVAVVGGCCAGRTRMIGAPALTATAALRSGVGLAKLVMPEPILAQGIAICPGATGIGVRVDHEGSMIASDAAEVIDALSGSASCLACGPGLGTDDGAAGTVLRVIGQENLPVVLDADGINCLAKLPEFQRDFRAAAVLTPHPGEFRTLCKALGLKDDLGLSKSRETAAEQMAQRLGRIVVLKGHRTVVSDGARTWTNPDESGHPCMATAGTGDVLTGVIAGIIAQFVLKGDSRVTLPGGKVVHAGVSKEEQERRPLDLFDAARLGVYIHGLCGVRWAEQHHATGGMLAVELTEELPQSIETLRR